MLKLSGTDFFPFEAASVIVEPRWPQCAFPEHRHDFYEIVIVDQGTGTHIFNGQPYTVSGGSVCFVRDSDHHFYQHSGTLNLTNVLYRAPDAFRYLNSVETLLPPEGDTHWRITRGALYQAQQINVQLAQHEVSTAPEAIACREMLFMQLLILLRRGASEAGGDRLGQLLDWLEEHFAGEICWALLADRFALSLRTLHRQLKQRTGLTPQRYLNRLRLSKAYYLLRHEDLSVTEIAFRCGFGDSNHFSTLFKQEYRWTPREIRLGAGQSDGVVMIAAIVSGHFPGAM